MSLMQYVPPPEDFDGLWYPISAAQMTAIHTPAQCLMFGGAAGPGKTSLLVADAAREADNPNFSGLFLRESFPQLEKSVLPKMRALYSQMGATYVEGSKRRWRFPSGAQIRLGFIQRAADIGDYQGGDYSLIDFDESTHHPEAHLRDLLPWWRTTDSSLFKRIRLATNPGGRGADWHMHTFLNNKCPYHFPSLSVKPGAIYKNATWLSDGVKIPFSVSFIPGLSTDHNMHGDDFRDLLATQGGERAEQLLHGCWCSLEGAYFPFLREADLVSYAEIRDAWWWNHFISIDYGYGNSSAAAGLYAVDEAGRVYKVDGFTESKMGSSDFAKECIKRWVEPKLGPERRRMVYAACDPANNAHTGNGDSNMAIMAEEFEKYDVPMVEAHKGRVDNFQRLYRGLKNGEFILCKPGAKETFRALATREHHDKIPGDIRKDHGNPLDDILDETSYALNTWIQSANKPGRIKMEETIAKMREEGLDEQSLMIHGHRMEQAMRQEDQPIKIGRSRIGDRRVVRR